VFVPLSDQAVIMPSAVAYAELPVNFSFAKPCGVDAVSSSPVHPALPTADECSAHLRLLEAFALAKRQAVLRHESAWHAYVQAGAARFAQWVSNLSTTEDGGLGVGGKLPPSLDVLMVWHAFMLNPVKYAEFEDMTNLPREGLDWAGLVSF
jgi:hypothetical protein